MPLPGFPADNPRRTLASLNLSARKSLGQNFLHDKNIIGKIVALARSFSPPYLEIGPGLGALTRPLAETGAPVVAVEVDRGLAAYLRDEFSGGAVEIVEADFLSFPGEEWKKRFPHGGTAVGNLPYSISSLAILRLIELREFFPKAVLMLQKEMVERLCAPPGCKDYGILSVYLSVLSETNKEFSIQRGSFYPSPDVDSAVITIRFFGDFPDDLLRSLQTVVRAGFARRRKMLRNAPVPFMPGGAKQWCEMLWSEGIDPSARAEEVPPASWLALARRRLLPASL
ncbi:MAG: 16S rRNA (adenine(1518)-N(6)/adenine(1519)-N(6))-dimethyltransferase RsmA [Syntrophorhabdaceae bacterium]|nr:16S rRNA (adenine(1518)-N(6)/adenine(1519)-N(6))-dimethyltransferase RsmA [Syntrophorhabdaceae bacterium]